MNGACFVAPRSAKIELEFELKSLQQQLDSKNDYLQLIQQREFSNDAEIRRVPAGQR